MHQDERRHSFLPHNGVVRRAKISTTPFARIRTPAHSASIKERLHLVGEKIDGLKRLSCGAMLGGVQNYILQACILIAPDFLGDQLGPADQFRLMWLIAWASARACNLNFPEMMTSEG
jgi:hypothetical protein